MSNRKKHFLVLQIYYRCCCGLTVLAVVAVVAAVAVVAVVAVTLNK